MRRQLRPGARRRGPSAQPLARRNATQSMQEVVTQNANGITEIIRPQPFMPNGELKGYRIYPGRNRDQFVGLGLQPGDLVTEINGMTLNNPAQAMEMFRSLADTTQVTVTIERDGQAQTLTLDTHAGRSCAAEPLRAEPPQCATGIRQTQHGAVQHAGAHGSNRGGGDALARCLVTCSHRAPAGRSRPGTITPNYKDADIRQVIEAVGAVTGKNFVLDPRVKAQVTMLSSAPMTPDAFYEAFLSILSVYGFVAVPSGDLVKILPDANARQVPGRGDRGRRRQARR